MRESKNEKKVQSYLATGGQTGREALLTGTTGESKGQRQGDLQEREVGDIKR